MRVLRGMAGALLWVGAALIGLVGAILCLTVVLLPVGIPLVLLARKMFTSAVRLFMPPALAHPVREAGKSSRRGMKAARDTGSDATKKVRKTGRKQGRRLGLG
jgi:hypothetical protein